MQQPLAYLNGQFLPAADAVIPLSDAGFVLGATVAEQLRTFRGRLFRLDDHLLRLWRSLEIVGVDPGIDRSQLTAVAKELAAHNYALLSPGDDLGLAIVVTPGPYASFAGDAPPEPLVCVHTYPLPFRLWADKYEQGQPLVTTPVEQVPSACWPADLKCRSRMHYYLADRHAQAIERGARALLLDADGFVTETATANVLVYRAAEGLLSPPEGMILPGITLAVVRQLADGLGICWTERPLRPADLSTADEVLLISTPYGLLPVTRFNGQAIGGGSPGTIYRQLLAGWSELTGVDLARQAAEHARR